MAAAAAAPPQRPPAETPSPPAWDAPRRAAVRWAILLAGILAGQAVLYGPSLAGRKILLPLDLLAEPGVYIPQEFLDGPVVVHDLQLSDLVYSHEPARRFGAEELRQGRWPAWTPFQYAGSPFMFPAYSPFWIIKFAVAAPWVLAWVQVLMAGVAGVGAYLFFRRVCEVGYWPATVAAWCYPLTAFFISWQGFALTGSIVWFPWLLLAAERVVAGPGAWRIAGLAAATCLVLVSGQLDVAGQELLVSGIFVVWGLFHRFGLRGRLGPRFAPLAAATAGWVLGFMLAAPYLLPTVEYTRTGARMARRGSGVEERPPIGLRALPEALFPYLGGSMRAGSVRILEPNTSESAAAAYCGLLATLVFAPLSVCRRRRRGLVWLLGGVALLGMAWQLDLPLAVSLLRAPLLKMMSHNRFVFATALSVLGMAAIGLGTLLDGQFRRRGWWLAFPLLLAGCGLWFVVRADDLPRFITAGLGVVARSEAPPGCPAGPEAAREIQATFQRYFRSTALWCAIGVGAWVGIWFRQYNRRWFLPAMAVLLAGDLLWCGYGVSAQCDPALYYPRIGLLQRLAERDDGRILGLGCLPATLSQAHDLRDIRGYDGVDPARLMDLMAVAADPLSPKADYTETQKYVPKFDFDAAGQIHLSPLLDMLAVRYLVFRGSAPPEAAMAGDDYWVLVNPKALPRAYVPARVECVADDAPRLERLTDPAFDARAVAYVESPVDLPEKCRGTARILDETPTEITVSARMETAGLVVLADLWDRGWKAALDGQDVPILRANHAVRGVVVPAGEATLVFRYQPDSRRRGFAAAALAVVALLGAITAEGARARRRRLADPRPAASPGTA